MKHPINLRFKKENTSIQKIATSQFIDVALSNNILCSNRSPGTVKTVYALLAYLDIEVFPNLSVDFANIQFERNYEQSVQLKIFNHFGQPIPIYFFLDAINSVIDVSSWEAEAYLLRFNFGNQFLTSD